MPRTFNLSALMLDLELFDKAEIRLEAADIDPHNSQAFNNLGSALKGRNRLDEALGVFAEAIRLALRISPTVTEEGTAAVAGCRRLSCHRAAIIRARLRRGSLLLANTLQDLGRFAEAGQATLMRLGSNLICQSWQRACSNFPHYLLATLRFLIPLASATGPSEK